MVGVLCSEFSRPFHHLLKGDRKHLNEAKKEAQDFYKDLPVLLEDIPAHQVHHV